MSVVWLIALGVLVVSVSLTGVVRAYALRTSLLDVPNSRSSHTRSTPRGGGLSIVIASMTGSFVMWCLGLLESTLLAALVVGGVFIAGIGFLDDRRGVSPLARLLVHVAASVAGVSLIGGIQFLDVGTARIELGLIGSPLAVVCMVWLTNLFNFMDGIDGIAASEASFVSLASATLMIMFFGFCGPAALGIAIGSASLGFLVWNWPPARIFMGDVGSGYLGYAIGILALSAAKFEALGAIPSLILGGVFFVDATATLVRRALRGEAVSQAHRTHAYQWMARRWGSHLKVVLVVLALNFAWLLPLAVWSLRSRENSVWMLVLALLPIVIGCYAIGAGRPETTRVGDV